MYAKHSNGRVNRQWIDGVIAFIDSAFNNPSVVTIREGKACIPCPCKRCSNLYHLDRPTVTKHILDSEFCPNYTIWKKHGEDLIAPDEPPEIEAFTDHLMEDLVRTVAGNDFDWEAQPPNPKAKRLFEALNACEEPLWRIDCKDKDEIISGEHSILSTITRLLGLKAEHQISQRCFDGLMGILKDVLPENDKFPSNFYQSKKLVQGLGMKYDKIDACVNHCMLYYKETELKEACDTCKEPRYEPAKKPNQKKKVPRCVLRYLSSLMKAKIDLNFSKQRVSHIYVLRYLISTKSMFSGTCLSQKDSRGCT